MEAVKCSGKRELLMLTEDNDGGSAADSPFVVVDAVFTVTPRDCASNVNISPLFR